MRYSQNGCRIVPNREGFQLRMEADLTFPGLSYFLEVWPITE
jgi:hypothetical protein